MEQLWIYLFLFLAGAGSFTLSTVSGGGGALLLVPILNFLIGAGQTAPVLNLGNLLGKPSRLILFWKHIQWRYVLYYVPAAVLGAAVGVWFFANMELPWIRVMVALFLISTLFQYRFGNASQSFPFPIWGFIPLGILVSIVSSMVGGMGPILNPFYLNAGIDKEALIATKTANSLFMGISQIGSYAAFGLMDRSMIFMGLAIGLGASLGNYFGKLILTQMSARQFRKWLVWMMFASGIIMLVRELFLG